MKIYVGALLAACAVCCSASLVEAYGPGRWGPGPWGPGPHLGVYLYGAPPPSAYYYYPPPPPPRPVYVVPPRPPGINLWFGL